MDKFVRVKEHSITGGFYIKPISDEDFKTIGVDSKEQADFIADAYNVHHETQLTPKQLLAQRDALLGALENLSDTVMLDKKFHEHRKLPYVNVRLDEAIKVIEKIKGKENVSA